MKIKILTLLAIFAFFINTCDAAVYKSNAETKRIPKGTKFKIQLQQPVSTNNNEADDYFSAVLIGDQKTPTNIILPEGSLIRGSVAKIVPSKRFSKGAVLYLDFDHIVTPRGRQMPLEMSVYATMKTTYDGGLYENLGYGEALTENWDKTVDITKNSVDFGMEAPSVTKIITVPVCAIGGALGGGLYWIGDSVVDMFKKGKDVIFNQGDILTVVLTNDIDVPVN